MTGRSFAPSGRIPLVSASRICRSDQLPRPVVLSAVRFVEYSFAIGMGNSRAPAFGVPFGIVWQPQPPASEKIYCPRSASPRVCGAAAAAVGAAPRPIARSEEHTSELQSRLHPVCRLLLEKK